MRIRACPARDTCALASRRVSPLLALEISLHGRPAANRRRIAGVDPADERRQSALGCAAHSWRAAQARVCGGAVDRRQVHGQEKRPVRSELGHLLRNHMPHIAAMDLFVVPTISFNLLYVLVIVRLARRELVWINVTATRRPNGSRSRLLKLPLERGPTLPDPRSGRDLRCRCQAPITGHGYPRQAHFAGLAVAEWVCRATDRHDPTGMSRPHDRVWGGVPASDPWEICGLL